MKYSKNISLNYKTFITVINVQMDFEFIFISLKSYTIFTLFENCCQSILVN